MTDGVKGTVGINAGGVVLHVVVRDMQHLGTWLSAILLAAGAVLTTGRVPRDPPEVAFGHTRASGGPLSA